MNQLSTEKRAQVVRCLVEGCSIRATVRMTGVAKNTISKLLLELGAACEWYQFHTIRDLQCERVQVDEIWSFVGAKEKNASEERKAEGWGDCWTWTALDADSKLAITWLVGERDGEHANQFISDLACRLSSRVQLTSDGLALYREAVSRGFSNDVDFAQIVKVFGVVQLEQGPSSRYSPPQVTGVRKEVQSGDPDLDHVSTSYVERQNLTMRMSMRRFTRLTNGFSKKVQNHAAAIALHFMYYNFCRIHQTLRVTPAMASGVADHLWDVEDLVCLLKDR